jgi:cytidyltransferase-like protein
MEKETVVAVSGGFDPIHPGHIRMFKEAKALGDRLVVILNNDNWLNLKKKFNFMSEKERKEVIESIRYVDEVVITRHSKDTEDMSVVDALREVKPDIFANGGDRKADNIPEYEFCNKHDIKMVFNVGHGGKVQSSSELVQQAMKKAPRKIDIKIKKSKH